MRDTRVRLRIIPETRTFQQLARDAIQAILRGMRKAARFVERVLKDLVNPPSLERLWIRERGRAEMAEAQLWFARRCAERSAA